MHWSSRLVHDPRVARFGHTTVAVDSTTVWGSELVIVFGGVRATGSIEQAPPGASQEEPHAALNDVLVYQVDADTWSAPITSSSSSSSSSGAHAPGPEPRAFHCAAVVGRRVFVFGGHVLAFDAEANRKRRMFYNDLWALDTDNWQWERIVTSEPLPPRRDMSSLTCVSESLLVLFGGRNDAGRASNDCWAFDLIRSAWSPVRAVGPVPPPRKMHAACTVRGRLILFGGERDMGILDDLWTLKTQGLLEASADVAAGGGTDAAAAAGGGAANAFRWTAIRLRPAPAGRFGHAMAVSGQRVVVYGGCLDTSSFLSLTRSYVQCNELWLLDLASFSWHKVGEGATDGASASAPESLASAPSERMCHTLTPLSGGRMLLLGGRKKEGICDDAWWLDTESLQSGVAQQQQQQQQEADGHQRSNSAVQSAVQAGGHLLASLLNPAAARVSATQRPGQTPGVAGVPQAASRAVEPSATADSRPSIAHAADAGFSRAAASPSIQGHRDGTKKHTSPEPGQRRDGKQASGVDDYTVAQAAANAEALENLRTRKLGLPLTPPKHFGNPPPPSAGVGGTIPPSPTHAVERLTALGEQLWAASAAMGSGTSQQSDGSSAQSDPVADARSYLSLLPPEEARLSHLEVILADLQQLASEQQVAVWRTAGGCRTSRTGGPVVGGSRGGPQGSADVGSLLGVVSSLSSAFVGLSLSDLRVSDVAALIHSYRHLLQLATHGSSGGGARGAAGMGLAVR